MEEKKDASTVELKLEKKNGKEKKAWTVKRFCTTVIIAILALLMVGGSFYYIFAPGFNEEANAFGKYDGESVLYESNNIFSRTLMSDEDYATAASTGDYSTVFSSWYKAYQAQVVYIALSKMADKAGVLAPQKLVNQMILDSGAYNGEDGTFSEEVYNSASDLDKKYFYSYMTDMYPFQTVVNDIYSTLTSAKEQAFVTELGANGRTFDYFVVDSSVYPDKLAKKYFEENSDYFKMVDMSMITCSTEEAAKECYDALKGGLAWSDAVAKYSADSYKENDGKLGNEYIAGVFEQNMTDAANLSQITALKVDEFSAPIASAYGWVIYKLNATSSLDIKEDDVLAQVKSVVYEKQPELVQNYIDEALASASDMVKKDFEKAAELYSAGLVSVGPAVNNPGDSSVLYGVENFDSTGSLYNAMSADEDLNNKLYSEAVGYIAGPIETEGGYLFARVSAASEDDSLGQITQMMYSYYVKQFDVVDTQNAVLASDKHVDNFTAKFLEIFFGQSAN